MYLVYLLYLQYNLIEKNLNSIFDFEKNYTINDQKKIIITKQDNVRIWIIKKNVFIVKKCPKYDYSCLLECKSMYTFYFYLI